MRKSKGFDNRTRKLFKRKAREKGLKSLRYLLEPFEVGQNVDIILNSQEQRGRPHKRYHGKKGVVSKIQGQSYVIMVKTGNSETQIISRPEHLRPSHVFSEEE